MFVRVKVIKVFDLYSLLIWFWVIPGFVVVAVIRCVEDQVMGGGGLIWV